MSLQLSDIDTLFNSNPTLLDVPCSTNLISSNPASTADDIYNFLSMYNKNNTDSSITKNDFLLLYNEQYAKNTELFIGIIVISAILAKLMFYPMAI